MKILTWNINYDSPRHGPWAERSQILGREIRAARPDLVALQAVRREPGSAGGLDQAAQLASELPDLPHIVYQPAHLHPDGSADGSAILAGLPISGHDYNALTLKPALDDTAQRIILHTWFDLPPGRFHLFNAHFSWVQTQTRVNMVETLPYLNNFPGPKVLVGDLNMTPDNELTGLLVDAGWTDAWAALHPGEPGLTFFEGGQMAKRIDYAWVSPELKDRLTALEVIWDDPLIQAPRPSDHSGLLLTLDLP